jgi:hypothetical protein
MPVILATQEAEIRKSMIRKSKTLYQKKKTLHKKRAGGMAQGVGPEFKLQYSKNQKKVH